MQILTMDPAALKMDSPFTTQHEQEFEHPSALTGNPHSPNDTSHHPFSGTFDFALPPTSNFDQHYGSPAYPNYSAPAPMQSVQRATLWPSELINPSPPAAKSPPTAVPLQPRPIAPSIKDEEKDSPTVANRSPPLSKAAQSQSTSRKTLTDADRRKMCLYQQENPNANQKEIAELFGVERSTISKLLKIKDRFLGTEDGYTSPTSTSTSNKKQKNKAPDVEKTLLNWARKRQAEGLSIDDETLWDEARKFAATLPNFAGTSQVDDPAWRESFKAKLLAKSRSDSRRGSSKASRSTVASSPPIGWDGTPLSAGNDGGISRSPSSVFHEGIAWGHAHSQSTASYGSLISDTGFSTDYKGPASPGLFSPITSSDPSPAMPAPKLQRFPNLAPATLQRRQTAPHTGGADDGSDPRYGHGMPIDHAHDNGMDISPIAVNTSMPQPTRASTVPSHSNFLNSASTTSPFTNYPSSTTSLMSPGLGSTTSPPVPTSPSGPPPSSNEALAALDTLRKYFHHQPSSTFDKHDQIFMEKWLNMLRISGQSQTGLGFIMPMTNERGDGTAPLGRKRSEHSLS